MVVIDKNSSGYVRVTEDGVTETLFPNIDETGGGGSVDPADIAAAVEDYMEEHPITAADIGAEPITTVVNKTASDTSQTLVANTFYIWPEMTTLTITCPVTGGPYVFRFTSGATPTTLNMTGIVMPDDFTVEANKVYEINVYAGYGLAVSWGVDT